MKSENKQKLNFNVGDMVRVLFKVTKGTKTRPSPFEGIVISKRGSNKNKTFTVRKQSRSGIAIERIFPMDSLIIENIMVQKHIRVRRAKLFYLRKKRK